MANRRTAPVTMTGDAQRDIGGAVVRRRFTSGGHEFTNGMVLSAGEVQNINPSNRKALLDNGFICIFPKPVRSHLEADMDSVPPQRHVISIGFGKWDVIEGRKVNAEPLTREQAIALAKPVEYQPVDRPKVVESTDEAFVPKMIETTSEELKTT